MGKVIEFYVKKLDFFKNLYLVCTLCFNLEVPHDFIDYTTLSLYFSYTAKVSNISCRAFENMLVPKSYRTPYLILFYSDWCFACLQVEPVWRRIMEELEPIGVSRLWKWNIPILFLL